MRSKWVILSSLVLLPYQASALFEIAFKEYFLEPPVNFEVIPDPYACNAIPIPPSEFIQYIVIRNNEEEPSTIAFYQSQNPFGPFCNRQTLRFMQRYWTDGTEQQAIESPEPYITHWKAITPESPEWDIVTRTDAKHGDIIKKSRFTRNWYKYRNYDLETQDYDYEWDNGPNRIQHRHGGLHLYEDSVDDDYDSEDDEELFDAGQSDYSGSTYRTSLAPDTLESQGGNLYDTLIASTPDVWPPREEVVQNDLAEALNTQPRAQVQDNAEAQVRPAPGVQQRRPLMNLEDIIEMRRAAVDFENHLARGRNRMIQRTGVYQPVMARLYQRPNEELSRLGYFIDPTLERSARREAENQRRLGRGLPPLPDILPEVKEEFDVKLEEEEEEENRKSAAQEEVAGGGQAVQEPDAGAQQQPAYDGSVDEFFLFTDYNPADVEFHFPGLNRGSERPE
ncbi:hypothetical protein AA313_de0202796 [Arthrobotrys entomopaga]|nr:hypothetical protein AA313_de0202796 [Arthrobotrys entomopaga]